MIEALIHTVGFIVGGLCGALTMKIFWKKKTLEKFKQISLELDEEQKKRRAFEDEIRKDEGWRNEALNRMIETFETDNPPRADGEKTK